MNRAVAFFLVVVAVLPEARAEELRYDLRLDIPLTAVAAGAWIATEATKSRLAPATCRWCDGADLNPIDRGFRDLLLWPDPNVAHQGSNVAAFALAPLAALGTVALVAGLDRRLRLTTFLIDALLIAEATAVAMDLNQVVKFAAGRERPFVRALPAGDKGAAADAADNNLSFFSGHATFAFALAASAGTVATLRGYGYARLVWAIGMPIAVATALLRVSGDRHYHTDVLVGAAIGSAIGVAGPLLHRGRSSVRPYLAGAGIGLTGSW